MNNIDSIGVIKKINLFAQLDDIALQSVIDMTENEYYPPNANIITQGELGDKIYFIIEGTAEAYTLSKEGHDLILGSIEKGNYFGELALLIQSPRNNSVRAKTACTVLSLNKSNFDKLLNQYPSISRALNISLGQRLGQTLHLISDKKENSIITFIYSDINKDQINLFINYFQKISPRPVLLITENLKQDTLLTLQKKYENHFFIIQNPNDFILQQANYILNFIDENPNHISLKDANNWKIEHTVRKINKKTIGIALCSGGAPGAAHFGVLKILAQNNIPLDYLVGTSIGAVAASSYAFGHSMETMIKHLESTFNKNDWLTLLSLLKYFSFSFSGVLKNSYYRKILFDLFKNSTMEQANIPFATVASDLYSGKTIVIKSGNVIDAIIASNAAPVIFEPLIDQKQLLIDGVATSPLPIQELIDADIDIKIAVPIPQLDLAVAIKRNPKLLAVFLRSRSMMAEQLTLATTSLADVIIKPDVSGIDMNDWSQLDRIVQTGEIAATSALKRIHYLFNKNHSF